MSGWRRATLRREALRNVTARGSRLGGVVLVAALLGAVTGAALVSEWRTLHDDLGDLALEGRGVVVLASGDPAAPARIDVASCRALAAHPAVARAGGFREAASRSFVQLGPLVPVTEVDPALVPGLARAAAVVGNRLGSFRAPLQLEGLDGSRLLAVGGEPEPSGLAGLNTAVAVALPADLAATSQCAVVLEPLADLGATVPQLLAAVRADVDLVAAPAQPGGFDVVGAYDARPSRFLPLGIGLLAAGFAAVVTRARSSEIAVYRLSGSTRVEVVRLLLLEQVLAAGALVAAGSLALVAGIGLAPAAPAHPIWVAIAGLTWLAAAGPAALLATRRSPADLARDR